MLATVAAWARVAWLSSGRVFEAADVPEQGVGMVLGAQANPGGPSAFLAARLDMAIDLYQSGKIRAILVTGDGRPSANDEPLVMRRYLESKGVPGAKIVEDPAGFDTYDSCVRAHDVYGVEQMTVITQGYHLNRALAACGEAGIDAFGVADTSMLRRYPYNWAKGVVRELPANVKFAWDGWSARQPQQDPPDPALLDAAES